MNEKVMRNCEILATNARVASKAFAWDYHYSHVAFAASYADEEAELEKVKEAKKIISKKNSFLSGLAQSTTRTVVAARILKDPDPEASMLRVKEIYKILKTKFIASEYTAVASVIVSDSNKDPVEVTAKMRKIYDLMNKKHYFLTSYDDLAVVALLATSDKSAEEIVDETEEIYKNIKSEFFSKSDAYMVSRILSLYDESVEAKCEAAVRIRAELKRAGIRFGSYGTAAIIAPLAIIAIAKDDDMLVEEIVEAERFLSKQKVLGGIMGVGKNMRSMLAASAVTRAYSDNENVTKVGATASAVIAAIAEEVAIMACIAASTAASASASASS